MTPNFTIVFPTSFGSTCARRAIPTPVNAQKRNWFFFTGDFKRRPQPNYLSDGNRILGISVLWVVHVSKSSVRSKFLKRFGLCGFRAYLGLIEQYHCFCDFINFLESSRSCVDGGPGASGFPQYIIICVIANCSRVRVVPSFRYYNNINP